MAKSKFKVGDKVISNAKAEWTYGLTGTIIPNYPGDGYLNSVLVKFSNKDAKGAGHRNSIGDEGSNWYLDESELKHASDDTFTIGSTTDLATDVNLGAQQRTILAHLKQGKGITQMKAMGVYHISRLSDVVKKLRNKGYNIETTMRQDEVGGKYAEYRLAA